VDVDAPSVRTVSSDFLDQDIKTETQQDRLNREAAAIEERAKADADKAKAEAVKAKKAAVAKAKKADNWLTAQFGKLDDNESSALVVANLAAVVGVSVFLGYKAWGLYERGRLGWQQIGIGAGILGAVGIVESFIGG
jgi:multidrug efflux pump subunit AcrA (membrane-fusion protein)